MRIDGPRLPVTPFSNSDTVGCEHPIAAAMSTCFQPAAIRSASRFFGSTYRIVSDRRYRSNRQSGTFPHQTLDMNQNTDLLTLGERLRSARREAGLTQPSLAKLAGVAQATISDIERGKSQGSAYIVQLARVLKVNPLWLLERKGPRLMRDLPPSSESLRPKWVENGVFAGTLRSGSRIPVIGTAPFGDSEHFVDMTFPSAPDGFVDLPSRDPDAYAVRCHGDSMSPRIKHGEYVVAEPGVEVRPGDEVIVKSVDGGVMVKQFLFRRDGRVHLASVNGAHQPFALADEQIENCHFVSAIVKQNRFVIE